MNQLKNKFISLGKENLDQNKKLDKQFNQISLLRILLTLIFLVLVIWFANARNGWGLAATLIPFPFIFGFLVNYHARIKFRRNHYRFLSAISEEEVERLAFKLKGFDPGERFINENHPFSFDFDVFGSHSLFQLINRSHSESGSEKLAKWMLNPERNVPKLQTRQEVIKYLSEDVEWRHDFEALGRHFKSPGTDIKDLLSWVKDKKRGFRLSMAIQVILVLASLASIAGFFVWGTSGYLILLSIGLNIFFLRKIFEELSEITKRTSISSKALKTFVHLIGKIENTSFKNDYLLNLKARFIQDGFVSSRAIKLLDGILDRLNSRANIFYGLLNAIFLFDFLLILKMDDWRNTYQDHIEDWLEALSEMECLVSLAGFAHLNPAYSYPEFREEKVVYDARNLGHPLIPGQKRVSNDFLIKEEEKILIITGSNMSGKSTFLRTVGLNAVLAYIGAPVCAESMQLSIMEIYTCMRVTDNLEENVSSFYAELKRIQGLIERTEANSIPVLYMLDEILKGTNSADRHKGAEALIRQMLDRNALGLISTHDLELGQLADQFKSISNYSFNCELNNGELDFDYTITEGVCRSFNASQLMKQMGIKVEKAN